MLTLMSLLYNQHFDNIRKQMELFGYANSNGRLYNQTGWKYKLNSGFNGKRWAVGDRAAHTLNSANGHKSSKQSHSVAAGFSDEYFKSFKLVKFQQHDKIDHQPLFKYCSPTATDINTLR